MGRNLIFALTAMLAFSPVASFANQPAAAKMEALDPSCDSLFYRGIENLDQAISENPNRLDLYMGKIDAMLAKKNYESVFVTSNKLIEVSQANNNAWLDANNQPMGMDGYRSFTEITSRISTLSERGQNGYAVALINKLVAAYPQESSFKKFMADYLFENKKEDAAYTIYNSIVNDYITDLAFVNKMAGLYASHFEIDKMNRMCTILETSGDDTYRKFAEKYRYDHETVDVDFNNIEAFAKKNPKAIVALTDRFVNGDQSLTLEELSTLYFGHAVTKKGCAPLWSQTRLAQSLFEEGKYTECLAACEKALERHPASLAANVYAYKALRQINDKSARLDNYKMRCDQLAHMIDCSAGNTSHQTFKILWQDDEDAFVDFYLADSSNIETDFANPNFFAVNGK